MSRRNDPRGDGPTDRTRRQWLLALGAGATAGLAGCSSDSGSSSDGDDEDDADDGGNGSTDSPSPGDGSTEAEQLADDGGPGCPSSFDYVTREYSALGQDGAIGQCAVPESARIETNSLGFTAVFEWSGEGLTSYGIGCTFDPDPDFEGGRDATVEGQVEFILENSASDYSRATGQYEVPDGSVVLVSETTVEGDSEIPRQTEVVMDHPDGVMSVGISATVTGCGEASREMHRRLVESQQPV